MPQPAAEQLHDAIATMLGDYITAKSSPMKGDHPVSVAMKSAVAAVERLLPPSPHWKVVGSVGKGNWANVPWLSVLDTRLTTTTQEGIYLVFLFRADGDAVYWSLNQGVTKLKNQLGGKEAFARLGKVADLVRNDIRADLGSAWSYNADIKLKSTTSLGSSYERSTIAWQRYDKGQLPTASKLADAVQALAERYQAKAEVWTELARPIIEQGTDAQPATPASAPTTAPAPPRSRYAPTNHAPFDYAEAVAQLQKEIAAEGFCFEPWQVAAYVTALRTKPFVILAGISGTGKSKLPRLVADLTGAQHAMIAVRPDWADSSDLLGYVDLQSQFRPGALLNEVRNATQHADEPHHVVLDEMNLARVEQYLAEVLSAMEDRQPNGTGGWAGRTPLIGAAATTLSKNDNPVWPANLALVGTVNMDETTHGFSRKVLDRAFTLEVSDVNLAWSPDKATSPAASAHTAVGGSSTPWPAHAWWPRATRLSELGPIADADDKTIQAVIQALQEANRHLQVAQLQVGYRVRDEAALFCLHARTLETAFRTSTGEPVAPLDLVLGMKLLPRLVGGSQALRTALEGLIGWAYGKSSKVEDVHATWVKDGHPSRYGTRFPRTCARLLLMWQRLKQEGFASYWL